MNSYQQVNRKMTDLFDRFHQHLPSIASISRFLQPPSLGKSNQRESLGMYSGQLVIRSWSLTLITPHQEAQRDGRPSECEPGY